MNLNNEQLTRRQMLRAGSAVLALPWLETFARADEKTPPQRLVSICTGFGLYGPAFFPAADQVGRDYKPSEYIEVLGDLREHCTVFSGISHPEIGGDHASESCFLTAAKHPRRPGCQYAGRLRQRCDPGGKLLLLHFPFVRMLSAGCRFENGTGVSRFANELDEVDPALHEVDFRADPIEAERPEPTIEQVIGRQPGNHPVIRADERHIRVRTRRTQFHPRHPRMPYRVGQSGRSRARQDAVAAPIGQPFGHV